MNDGHVFIGLAAWFLPLGQSFVSIHPLAETLAAADKPRRYLPRNYEVVDFAEDANQVFAARKTRFSGLHSWDLIKVTVLCQKNSRSRRRSPNGQRIEYADEGFVIIEGV